MGLDATVRCNCFEEGLTKPPPFPLNWLILREDGYFGLRPEADVAENWRQFEEWEKTCCEHKQMEAASEHISNWSGYRLFQAALENVGWENFPLLAKELPNANGGLMASEAAASALFELDLFRRQPFIGQNAAIIDSKSGYVIFEHISAYEGVFVLDGLSGIEMGVGEFEFFVRERTTGNDMFRATRVRQTFIDPVDENVLYLGRVQFHDVVTGAKFVGHSAVWGRDIAWPDGRMQNDDGQIKSERVEEFHVEVRDQVPADFDYVLNPLTKVFQASVKTGNPVRWC